MLMHDLVDSLARGLAVTGLAIAVLALAGMLH
ncbi:hypothetical protein EDC65_4200 [Stella humosa]|uniref:Uncharacterized protein n=1 Tax=Stella humosa TaxID=94 RepID=A0A3N1KVP6_9PROT|nr:hypothetical protein EDC65_4200 [Stella humosa]